MPPVIPVDMEPGAPASFEQEGKSASVSPLSPLDRLEGGLRQVKGTEAGMDSAQTLTLTISLEEKAATSGIRQNG